MADCPNDCSNQGICHNGTCFCNNQFKGVDCSQYEDPCPNDCSGNGVCDDILGKCVCKEEYVGQACEQWVYGVGGPLEDPCRNECSGNGVCQYQTEDNVTGAAAIVEWDFKNGSEPSGKAIGCVCPEGTSGPDCKSVCQSGCNGNGRCIGGVCACDEGFAGEGCQWKKCPYDCNDNGYCRDGVCMCKEGYNGDDCGMFTDEAMSYKCIKHCAPHCLKACSIVFKNSEGDKAAKAHDCYNKCTEPCLEECQSGGLLGSVGASMFD